MTFWGAGLDGGWEYNWFTIPGEVSCISTGTPVDVDSCRTWATLKQTFRQASLPQAAL